jgi:hypothetical protein
MRNRALLVRDARIEDCSLDQSRNLAFSLFVRSILWDVER